MKPLAIVLLSAGVSTATAGATAIVLKPASGAITDGAAVVAAAPSHDLATLRAELASQRELLAELSQRLTVRAPATSPPATRASATEIEDVVRDVLDGRETASPARLTLPDETAPAVDGDLVARLSALRAAGLSDEAEALWQELRAAGALDEAVALFEEYAELHPGDPEAHVMLGNAYIQRLQEESGAAAGPWAMKADAAYTAALDLDDHNWEARFSKAVSLSFWPPIFGKQQEAISHFETLLDQQSRAVPEPGHAQTYVFLGNLYQQQGDIERASELWANGLAAFPDDDTLQAKNGDD